MHKLRRALVLLGACVIVSVCMAACGGGGTDAKPVVRVGDVSFSKAAIDHWIAFQAVVDYQLNPQHPVPKGVIPDPPAFTACVGHLEAIAPKQVQMPSTTQLRSKCQQNYQALKQHVLGVLISFEWLIGESAGQGVSVSEGEVERQYARYIAERLPHTGELKNYLANTGASLSDELLRTRVDMLATRLLQKLTAQAARLPVQQRQRVIERFYAEIPRRWVPKTSCSVGYVIPDCRQYEGPASPEAKI